MIITNHPTRIHPAFNPIVIIASKEEADTEAILKIAFTHDDNLPSEHITITREFFNNEAHFNLSSLIASQFVENESYMDGVIVNDYMRCLYSVFKNDDTLVYKGIALNSVCQLGYTTDMVGYLGYFLTEFDTVKIYEGYERIIYALSFEQGTTYLFVDGNVALSTKEKHFRLDITHANSELSLANSEIDRFLRNNQGQVITNNFGEPITILDEDGSIHRRFIVEKLCPPRNPFYVRWVNDLGGIDCWMFGIKQEYSTSLESTTTFEPYVRHTESVRENIIPIDAEISEKVIVGSEGLSENEYRQISKIISSPFVEWYDDKREKWMRIFSDKGNISFYTESVKHEIELKFILPKRYLQF